MLKSILKIFSGTLVSRITGFFRELVYAYLFGASAIMDIWVVVQNIPNIFREIFGEKAIESAFLPVYSKLKKDGNEQEAQKLLKSFGKFLLIFTTVIVALTYIFLPQLLKFFAPGLSDFTQAQILAKPVIIYIYLISFSSLFGSMLLSLKKFMEYSITPAIANIIHLIVLILSVKFLGDLSLSVAFIASGLSMLIFNFIFFKNTVKNFHLKDKKALPNNNYNSLKEVKKRFIPIVVEMVFSRLSTIVDRRLASLLIEGSISSLYFSFRLVQLPFSLVSLAINRVVIVDISENFAVKNFNKMKTNLFKGIKFNWLILAPIVAILIIFRVEIVSLVFQRGAFTHKDSLLVGYTLIFYSIGLFGLSLTSITSRFLYVIGKSKTAMLSSIFSLSLNIILNYLLYKTTLKVGGIALATSISFTVNGLINFIVAIKYFNIYKNL